MTNNIENYRQSISTNNIFDAEKGCPYQYYLLKISQEEQEPDLKPQYGNAGTAVHEALEYYYKNKINELSPVEQAEELKSIRTRFDQQWMDNKISQLNKLQYWNCILNGINDNWVPTETEEFVNIENNNYSFVAKIDARRGKEWVLDYKTSTFSHDKVTEYFHQLIGYAFAIYKKHGYYPEKLVVMFLKQKSNSKTFTHSLKFSEDDTKDKSKYYSPRDVERFEEELKNNQIEFVRRTNNLDWVKNKNNCFFCNFKKMCYQANNGTLKFDIVNKDGKMYLRAFDEVQLPKLLVDKIYERLSYYLPEKKRKYAIRAFKEKTGKDWDGGFHLFNTGDFSFNRGFVDEVKMILKHYANATRKTLIVRDLRLNKPLYKGKYPVGKLNFPYELYQYQKEAVYQATTKKVGVIKLPTGAGKSVIAADIIRRLNTTTLFTIDNKELLEQTKKDYEELLGIKVGAITEGEFNPGKLVTVATIQTITRAKIQGREKGKDYSIEEIQKIQEKNEQAIQVLNYLKTVNLSIHDECHIIASDSFKFLNKNLKNNEYTIGFSATPFRTDGHTMLIEERCGKVIYEKSIEDLEAIGLYKRPDVSFKNLSVPENKPFFKEFEGTQVEYKPTHHDYYDRDIVNNEERNNLIKSIVEGEHKDKQCLIVCSKISHMELLKEMIPGSEIINGSTKQGEMDGNRKQILDDFKECRLRVLISNISIMYKGLNIHTMEVLINAAANESELTTTQLIGRLLRDHPEGNPKFYVDFEDKDKHYDRFTHRFRELKLLGFNPKVE